MKAVRVVKFLPSNAKTGEAVRESLELADVPVPLPGPKQVLVRVEYSPINPADISIAGGNYGGAATLKTLSHQIIPGTEGSGVVVGVGKGVSSAAIGARVTFYAPGAWAEYVVVDGVSCIPLPKEVSFQEGCNSFANPVSVVAFIQLAKAEGQRNIVHTAAASALGKMLIAYGKEQGVGVIGVVRKEEQAKEVLAAGARACVVMSDDDIQRVIEQSKEEAAHEDVKTDEKKTPIRLLEEAMKEHKVTMGFDAVAGPSTGVLLKAMLPKSVLYVYGGLSGQPAAFLRATDLIFGQKQVRGFWAIAFVKNKRLKDQQVLARQVLACVRKGQSLHTVIKQEFPLANALEGIASYLSDQSGKICIVPAKDREAAAAEAKAAEAKAAEAKPAEAKPAEAKPTEPAPAASTPEAKPAEAQPAAAESAAKKEETPAAAST